MTSPIAFMGSSGPARAFEDELRRVAGTEVTVLLSGESGVGKGVAARLLHQAARPDGPFVVVHLAALSPTLLEAALFGHERGAFTDARRARPGFFRQAAGGTIVLDDVDLLPLELQPKLLRVLQERAVEPLGSAEPIPVDARVVATTNRDLLGEVEAGRFRRDLYYRLAVVHLELPPLRARRSDLPALVEHFTKTLSKRLRLAPRTFLPEALQRLAEHAWPGNVRELENAVERVLVLGQVGDGQGGDGEGGKGEAPSPVGAAELDFLAEPVRGMARELAVRALSHGITLEGLTRALLEEALEENRGNVSAAARQVGLTRRAFDYRMARPENEDRRDEETQDASDASEGAA